MGKSKLNQNNFFTQETLSIFTERINNVTQKSERVWGTMTPDQMLHHLNLACGSSMGYFKLPDESTLMTRTMGKWLLVDLLPTMPKGLKMPVGFAIPHTEHFDFEKEKNLLLEILNKAYNTKSTESWTPHVGFGRLSKKEWGKLLTKHIDYHLKQFNS